MELSDGKMITTVTINGAGIAYLPDILVKKHIVVSLSSY